MGIQKLGRYEIMSELGRGTMGIVYKALDPVIERTVAIKAINLDLPKDEFENFEERFYREAKSAGRLNHPNIVTIYDAGKVGNTAYIAMEFLEGRSLREILDSGADLPVERIGEIAAQIADGLAYAQQYGIVHRDIKPANIMFTNAGQAKITDFGIAYLPAGSKTEAGTILGSPKYMSPEQIVGKPVDGRSDIFSLGVMLYEMVTGKKPFDGESISTIMYRILNEMPPDIREINPQIPAAFDSMIYKALAKLPENRYQNASEFAHDLRNYQMLPPPVPVQLAMLRQAPGETLERRAERRTGSVENTLELPGAGKSAAAPAASADLSGRAYRIIELPGAPAWENPPAVAAAPKPRFSRKIFWGMTGLLAAIAAAMLFDQPEPTREKDTAVRADAPAPDKREAQENSASADAQSGIKTPSAGQSDKKIRANKVGYLKFSISPGGEVYVDGNKVGVSPPLKRLALAPGKHQITVKSRTPPYHTYVYKVEITANQSTLVKAEF
ncbi:MAG: protein kinase domain-containing protein [Burkholderiales bacterium]